MNVPTLLLVVYYCVGGVFRVFRRIEKSRSFCSDSSHTVKSKFRELSILMLSSCRYEYEIDINVPWSQAIYSTIDMNYCSDNIVRVLT